MILWYFRKFIVSLISNGYTNSKAFAHCRTGLTRSDPQEESKLDGTGDETSPQIVEFEEDQAGEEGPPSQDTVHC